MERLFATSLRSNDSIKLNMVPIVAAGAVVLATTFLTSKLKEKENDNQEIHHSVKVTLPKWAQKELPNYVAKTYTSDEEMMSLAIHLSRRNVEEGTGGPFGSAVFERNLTDNTATLVSVGMNRVVPLSNSTLHGEMIAIQLAQSKLQNFSMQCIPITTDEGDGEVTDKKMRQFELFTSCEPCAMCLGATLWSGVSRIVCGATKHDAEAIGFDEGPVFEQSYDHLQKAGVRVTKAVLQAEAAKVLEDYGKNGLIYN